METSITDQVAAANVGAEHRLLSMAAAVVNSDKVNSVRQIPAKSCEPWEIRSQSRRAPNIGAIKPIPGARCPV